MTKPRRNPHHERSILKLARTLALALVGLGAAVPASAKPAPRISLVEARATALAAVPGTVVDEEFEREHGRKVWCFEIAPTGAPKGLLKEVVIDARSGKVLAIEEEHDGERGESDDDAERDDDDDEREESRSVGVGRNDTQGFVVHRDAAALTRR